MEQKRLTVEEIRGTYEMSDHFMRTPTATTYPHTTVLSFILSCYSDTCSTGY